MFLRLLSTILTVLCISEGPTKTSTMFKPDFGPLSAVQDSCSYRTKTITKDFILGKFNYKTDSCFVKVDPLLSNKTLYLQQEVYASFLK
ncbi:hypothetical protein [Formosa haliotis]|uniref:hypothetical protein n=1 Tax=Formosa haliotis TaxID=1555194 RepID=UPI00082645AE|nr:hypothetical protein [Formosa haliotis]